MTKKTLVPALAAAAGLIGTALVARWMASTGVITDELARRVVQVTIGLVLAVNGNYMPKQFGVTRGSTCARTKAQSALRVGGWAMTLAGVIYMGLWALTPVPFADIVGSIVVALALVVTLGYSTRLLWRRGGRASTGA